MPQQVFGAEAAVSMVNRALANTSPAHTVYLNQVAAAGTTDASQYAFAAQLGAQYAVGKTAADLSALLLGNMGVSNDILQAALTDYIAFHGEANIGIIALQLGQILSGLEGDVTFGAAAAAWNQEVTNAYQYSSSPNNNTPQTGDDGANTTKLSRFTDVLTGHEFTGYLDYNQFQGADEQTLTTSDRLTGTDAADDVLFAQLTGGARPTLNGIEIVSIDAKANAPELNLSDANGVKTIINVNSNENSTLTFSNLKNLVDVAIKNTNGNTKVEFNASVVAGTADALNLSVEGVGVKAKAANVTVQGIETLNIAATGNASVLGTVASDNVKTLTITGDQNLTVGTKGTKAAADALKTAADAAKVTADTNKANAGAVETASAAVNTAIGGIVGAVNAGTIATAIAGAVPAVPALTATTPAVVAIAEAIMATAVAPVTAGTAATALAGATTSVLSGYTTAATNAANDVTAAAAAVTAAAAAAGFTSANIKTVDASAATGNLFLNLAASAGQDQTVKTGSGNDVVVTGNLMAVDTFDLGAGNDRLVLTTVSTNEAAKLIGVEEVEARVAGTNLNLTNAADVKLLAVADLGVASKALAAGFANVTAMKTGTTVAFEGRGLANAADNKVVNFGDVTYNIANNSAADVVNFTFGNGGVALGANSTVNIGKLNNTGANVETLNFTFSDLGATGTVKVEDISASAALKTLNVVADGKVELGGVNDLTALTLVDATGVTSGFKAAFAGGLGSKAAATIKLGGVGVNNVSVGKADFNDGVTPVGSSHSLLTLDASAAKGNQTLTITGNADVEDLSGVATAAQYAAKASVSVLGGSAIDTITVTSTAGTAPADTVNLINGGAGADTIILTGSGGVDVIVLTAGSSNSTNKDIVTGFTTATDKFDLSSFGFDAALQGVTNGTAALNGTAAEFGSKAAYFDTAATTLYVDVNGDNKFDANDLVVVLTTGTVDATANDILWA